MSWIIRSLGLRIALALCVAASTALSPATSIGAETTEPNGVMRRLSAEQYRRIIADTFGPAIKIVGRFEPDVRYDGLFAVGASRAGITAAGIEHYDTMARAIAAQVVSENNRSTLIPCQPRSANAPDDTCTAKFLSNVGMLLFRRPLSQRELQGLVQGAGMVANESNSFYTGLASGLANILVSLPFLFRQELTAPSASDQSQLTLDGFSRASRLSFFLWNTAPDRELLSAAQTGALRTPAGLARQVDRLIASPRLEVGARAFFSDMLRLADLDTMVKDVTITPKYGRQIAEDAREQTLRTIVDMLLRNDGDTRDLFTTRSTYLTPRLASLYRVPFVSRPNVFAPHQYREGDARAGLLSQASFTALFAHAGRSSPTLRGKALREIFLCETIPNPPGNVDFVAVQDTKSQIYKTARDRLKAHESDPGCAGCHKVIDIPGLALENFDGAGGYRTKENGAAIDVGAELNGVVFTGPPGLAQAMHDNPAVPQCLVNRIYAYATGRAPSRQDATFLSQLYGGFRDDGYRLRGLLRRLVTSDAFYRAPSSLAGAATP